MRILSGLTLNELEDLMSELGVMLFNMESKVFVKNEYSIGC